MKRKDIETLAKKIAKCEMIIKSSDDKEKIRKAEKEILNITKGIKSVSDMLEIDELVMELLEKN